MIITGLDLSLTGTGIATIDTTGHQGLTAQLKTITSSGKKTATLDDRTTRLRKIRNAVITHVTRTDTQLAVIEGPAFASQVGQMWDRAGLWWLVLQSLHHARVPVVQVAPAQLKKFATDNGACDKNLVVERMQRLWGDRVRISDNNQADALALATMGGVRCDRRNMTMTLHEHHLLVVSAIEWPV